MTDTAEHRMTRLSRWLLAASGAVPVLGLFGDPPETTLLCHALFVVLVLALRRPLAAGAVAFLAAGLVSGLLIEFLAWLGHFIACDPEPALFHPQLGADLAIASGFYLGNAAGWLFLFRRFGFSLAAAFCITGFYGVFIEQQGAVFLAGLGAMPQGVLLWLYVFAVYGAMAGIPRVLVDPAPRAVPVVRRWWHYPLALAVIALATIAGLFVTGGLLELTLGTPPKQDICAAWWW